MLFLNAYNKWVKI